MGSSEWANNLEMTVNNLAKNAKDNENDVASRAITRGYKKSYS